MINQTVYRILQSAILLIILFFVLMIVHTVRNLDDVHTIIDLVTYIISIISFSILLFIMDRDKKRAEKR